jgi:hypothetical protein
MYRSEERKRRMRDYAVGAASGDKVNEHKKWRIILMKICMVLLVCASIYPALYVLLLDPEEELQGDFGRFVCWRIPSYRIRGQAIARLFAPLNRLDRAVRPSYWAEREVRADELEIEVQEIPIPEPVDPGKAVGRQ